MPGVEILSETIVYETTTSVISFILPIIIGIGITFLLFLAEIIADIDCLPLCVPIIILTVIIGMTLGFRSMITTDTIDYIEYKVTISDEVSMNEFLDYYEILDQEGKIYTVKERNPSP